MVNERLEQIRKHFELTKKEFAEKLGITQQAYINYAKGKRDIPSNILLKVNRMFNISTDWLLTGRGEMFLKDEPKIVGIDNSVVGQVGNIVSGTVTQQGINIGNNNTTTIQSQPPEDKKIQELIETFKQLPPELQDYHLNIIKAELAKYQYEQKKQNQGKI